MPRWSALWFATALAAVVASAAGPSRRAELEEKLRAASPAERSALLSELSFEIETDDTERAWDLAQQARKAAASAADEVRADTRIASLLRRRGRYDEALAGAKAPPPAPKPSGKTTSAPKRS
jgi:hypothetical protein